MHEEDKIIENMMKSGGVNEKLFFKSTLINFEFSKKLGYLGIVVESVTPGYADNTTYTYNIKIPANINIKDENGVKYNDTSLKNFTLEAIIQNYIDYYNIVAEIVPGQLSGDKRANEIRESVIKNYKIEYSYNENYDEDFVWDKTAGKEVCKEIDEFKQRFLDEYGKEEK